MNMKKITLGCSLLFTAVLFLAGCNKKVNEAPVQDMEFQTSKDATFANSLITEIEIIASYLGEGYTQSTLFFSPAPTPTALPSGSITTNHDPAAKSYSVTYTGSVTCRDGKKRNGTIILDYSQSSSTFSATSYRDAGFVGKVSLVNYWVDGIVIDDATPFVIKNNVPFGYNPASTDLSWTMDGYFSVREQNYLQDSSRNMVWKGTLTKTLVNTENPDVFKPSKVSPINWSAYNAVGSQTAAARVAYTGTVQGVTARFVSYKLVIDDTKPEKAIVRNFGCTPDKVLGVVPTPSVVTYYSEWHPFVSGVASFTSFGAGTTEGRVIDFASGEGSAPCDNAGTVYIKGITYPVDFRK